MLEPHDRCISQRSTQIDDKAKKIFLYSFARRQYEYVLLAMKAALICGKSVNFKYIAANSYLTYFFLFTLHTRKLTASQSKIGIQ